MVREAVNHGAGAVEAGGMDGDGGIDDGMPRHIGIVPPGARLTVVGHERVVRLDLVRALDERRDLTRRAARRTRGHHRAPMGPVGDGDCDCDLSVLARVESSLLRVPNWLIRRPGR